MKALSECVGPSPIDTDSVGILDGLKKRMRKLNMRSIFSSKLKNGKTGVKW